MIFFPCSLSILRFQPLFTENLLQFGILSCDGRWCRHRADSGQVLHQLNVLPWSIWATFALTVEPLSFQTVNLTITHSKKEKKKTLRHSDAFVLMILSTRIYTPLFLCHYIAIQDLQAQAPTHDIWPIVETRQRWGRHNTRVAHDGKLLQLMKWRQVWHLE